MTLISEKELYDVKVIFYQRPAPSYDRLTIKGLRLNGSNHYREPL